MLGTASRGKLCANCIVATLIPVWLLSVSHGAQARVTSIMITSRTSPAFAGASFTVGA